MKYQRNQCIDCGSDAVETLVDTMPNFKMEVIRYACGSELRHSFSTSSNMGKSEHAGCPN